MLIAKDIEHLIQGENIYLSRSLGEIATILSIETPGLWALVPYNELGEIDFHKSVLFNSKQEAESAMNPEREVLVRFVPILIET